MHNKGMVYIAVAASLFAASEVSATEFRASTVRALGMGGSNVASTKGVNAAYWNPAAYGFLVKMMLRQKPRLWTTAG